ncbi:PspC domain-containing protein [Pseudonocardia xinjiangensis]|uniref:PspC domain-containing protein n=1 Tax=Pseudonocardia xinjiangensis TaxID=75289 RepID=A0ABX1RKQ9_9PSEU|nr:PspC domain-containing protein [Pseudonocardia xinjiangensis]NMH80970.1 PspC domain-containing protein [Pseudonocardia xinjiangensis]
MNRTDVHTTLREMWDTRPARPRDDRQVAGVAAAIARRYDIDPTLVRVGFVVAAFTGIGAALYIAGWFLLPEQPADPTAPAQPRPPRTVLVIGLAIAALVSVGSIFGGDDRGILFPALAVAVLLFLLHRSRGHRGTGAAASAGAEAPTTITPSGVSLSKETAGTATPPVATTPPAWDPLGAAPFAWDLPEPSPVGPPPAPAQRRLPVTSVTLGLALLAGGITAVIMLLAGALTLANLPVVLGVTLAVIGAGLVLGAFVRSGRGLIPVALVLGALTWALVAAPLDRWQGNGVGELRAAPTTVAALQPSYQRTAGEIALDLRNLDLSVPPGGNASPVRSAITLGVGDVELWVPQNADLTLTSTTGVGDVEFDGRSESGPGAHIAVTDDLGADGVPTGRPLVVTIETGAGSVEVHRG